MKQTVTSMFGRRGLALRLLCLTMALCMLLLSGCRKTPDQGNDPPDAPATGEDKPTGLRINLLSEPFGVDKNDLRFSWAMNDAGSDAKQAAYRIVIAKGADKMAARDYVLDTDWVNSSKNTAVSEPGLAAKLADNTLYYWSVSTRNQAGVVCVSDPQAFTTAVGDEWESTNGIWAAKPGATGIDEEISDDWTDYTVHLEFSIDANALGVIVRAKDAKNFYMWQFKVEGDKAYLCPHVYKDGKFVNNSSIAKVEIPANVAFGIGDTVKATIECKGNTITTAIEVEPSGDYAVIDQRDVSEYGFEEGTVGFRTGGSESGKVYSMYVLDEDNARLYRSNFTAKENPFSKCSISDGVLAVTKAISTGDLLNRETVKDFNSGASGASFVFLRTELALTADQMAKLDRAVLSVTATSPESTRQYVYNMYVNGNLVGVGPSRYGQTPDGQDVLYYNTYDVTKLLTAGDNCLSTINYTTGGRAFLSQLTLYYKDGTSEIVSNSARDAKDWCALSADDVFGMDNSIGTKYFLAHANNINASLYPFGFGKAGFDDSAWNSVFVIEKIGGEMLLLPSQTDNVSRYESTGKASVNKLSNGDTVIDLGGEIIGGIRFTVDLPSAATVNVYYGEQLNGDGSVKYQMMTGNVYEETWQLVAGKQTIETIDLLTYRYVQISGCPVDITPDMVQGLEVRAAFDDEASDFTSDNALLGDIYDLMKRTIKMTTQDLFVDSQSRERLAYEGDLIINLLASYAFGSDYSIGRFSNEYLMTHRTWPAEYYLFSAISALDDYMTTGDLSSLNTYYDVLKTRVYTQFFDEEVGLLTTGNAANNSSDNAILVDWPASERDGYDFSVKFNTVLNAVAVGSYETLAQIATLTGHDADAEAYTDLAETIKEAMIERLYNSETGAFADGLHENGQASTHYAQHATAFALAFGIYEDQAMADRMAQAMTAPGKIRMSVYGAFFLFKGLYESGNGALANRLLLDEDDSEGARTWAYMLYTLGATITAEAWNSTTKNNMTMSHPWGATPAYAIMSGIFGIRPTSAGYETFDVRLQTEGVGKASLTVPTIKGDITVSFDSTGASYKATVTVPANTQATVYLPADKGSVLTVNGETVQASYKDGFISVTVGSGEWNFEVK
ncbi:MAG: hypothetical protein E7625_06920 [Ruminococcaceae bacterium]|nr:hypothetical protein [Oscillospiraceae bacterium]